MGVRALAEPRRLRAPARRRGRLGRLSAQPPPARRDRARFPVAAGLGDTPEPERPLEATLWGEPPCGRATARLADGTTVRWRAGEWSVTPERQLKGLTL